MGIFSPNTLLPMTTPLTVTNPISGAGINLVETASQQIKAPTPSEAVDKNGIPTLKFYLWLERSGGPPTAPLSLVSLPPSSRPYEQLKGFDPEALSSAISFRPASTTDGIKNWRSRLSDIPSKLYHALFTADLRLLNRYAAEALSKGVINSASGYFYDMGNIFWRQSKWGLAEEAWLLGARVFLKGNYFGPLDDDPIKDAVIATLEEAKIVSRGPKDETGAMEGSLYYGGQLLLSRYIGGGRNGDTIKIFGQDRAIKEMHDYEYVQISKEPRRYPLPDDLVKYKTDREAQRLLRTRASGVEIVGVYAIYDKSYVKDLIPGPSIFGLARPKYGLSAREIIHAIRQYPKFVKTFYGSGNCHDPGFWRNAVYDLRDHKWVLIDN